jgi:hypothetical protein
MIDYGGWYRNQQVANLSDVSGDGIDDLFSVTIQKLEIHIFKLAIQ